MAVVSKVTTLTVSNGTGSRTLRATAAVQDTAAGGDVVVTITNTTAGGSPPLNPSDEFSLHVRVDDGAVNVRSYTLDTAAASQQITLSLTSTGQSGAAARIGTLRMRLFADNSGIGGWTANSDDATNDDMPVLTSATTRNQGWLRGIDAAASVVANNTALGGAAFTGTYAYHDDVYARLTSVTAYDTAATVTLGVGAGLSQSDASADGVYNYTWTQGIYNNFPDSSSAHDADITAYSNSALTGQSWTAITLAPQSLTIDPRLTLANLTLGESLYNRGEVTTTDLNVRNARGENLTESIAFQLKNSGGTVRQSSSDTGANYDIDYTLTSSDDAAFDFVGAQWTLNTNQGDVDSNPSASVFKVSRKLMLGATVGSNDLAVTTDEDLYNRGESPQIDYVLSYARGVAYASMSGVTSDVVNTGTGGNEDSQSQATDAAGAISYSYTITAGDAAAADAVGEAKHVEVSKAGNATDDSADEWAASSLYYLDVHPQLSDTLSPDSIFGDETEAFAGVILGDVIYTWLRVIGVRQDGTNIDTSGSGVSLIVKNPSGGVEETYNVDTNPDGWSDRIDVNPAAPAGDWTFNGSVAFGGNSAADVETVTYISPLTSNLQIVALGPVVCKPAQSVRVWFRTEIDGAASEPQSVPVWRLYDSVLDTVVDSGTALNAVDDSATLNGARYYIDIVSPATAGRFLLWAEAQLNGNPIKTDTAFRVAGNGFDPTGLFAGPA